MKIAKICVVTAFVELAFVLNWKAKGVFSLRDTKSHVFLNEMLAFHNIQELRVKFMHQTQI